jgi:hypothetical protein
MQHKLANQFNKEDTAATFFFCPFPLHKLTTTRGEGSQSMGQHSNSNAIHSHCFYCFPNQNGANILLRLHFFALMLHLAKNSTKGPNLFPIISQQTASILI